MQEPVKRLELSNSLPHTVTWVYIGDGNRLTIEWYDHSEEAQNSIGGDVAFLLHIDDAGKQQIRALLADTTAPPGDTRDDALLQMIQQRFGSYSEIKSWLIDNNIPFEAEFDSTV